MHDAAHLPPPRPDPSSCLSSLSYIPSTSTSSALAARAHSQACALPYVVTSSWGVRGVRGGGWGSWPPIPCSQQHSPCENPGCGVTRFKQVTSRSQAVSQNLPHGSMERTWEARMTQGKEMGRSEGVYMKTNQSKNSLHAHVASGREEWAHSQKGPAPSVPSRGRLERQCRFVWPDT